VKVPTRGPKRKKRKQKIVKPPKISIPSIPVN